MTAAARADPAVLERLRERIRTLQAAPRQLLSVLRTGLPPVDGLLPGGGFPLGQVVELWGEPASGRARLAFRAIAEAHRALRLHVAAAGAQAMRLEVVRSRQGGVSGAVEVPWELLTPGGPSDIGAGNHGLDAPPLPMPPSMPFRRVRACTLRDGLVGIHGQRPGRDLPLPSFAPALGVGA